MGYLRDHPVFEHVILIERDAALWLVPDADGRWTLPGFVSGEQHTAEVEQVTRHIRAHHGLRVCILASVSTEFDERANRVRKAYLAEALDDAGAAGSWWPRASVVAGEAPVSDDLQRLVLQWATGSLATGHASWSRGGWLAEALEWVSGVAGAVSEFEQVRVSEFSTVVRVVAAGTVKYFKAVGPQAAIEPQATAALASRTAHIPPVLAVDPGRRFLLMEAFGGEPLETQDTAAWADAAGALSELQRECVGAVAELQALGCDVMTATTLVEPLSALLADDDALLVGEAAGLSGDEVMTLRSLAPRLSLDAQALDAGPIPPMIDHGDLWPSNVLVGPAGCAFVDWEDVRIAHPFLTPFQLLAGAHLDGRFGDESSAYLCVRDAYLAGWSGWAPAGWLRQAFDVAHDIAAVAVAASYRRYPPAVLAAHPWMREMPAFCLRRIVTRRAWADPERSGPARG